MDNWNRFFRKGTKRKQNLPDTEESKPGNQEQPGSTAVVPQPKTSRYPATKQGLLRSDPIQASNSKVAHKQIQRKQEDSRTAGRRENAKIPSSSASSIRDERVIKQQAEEQHRKKLLRRQIRKGLDDLHTQGNNCEASQIISFIQTFGSDIGLVREVLTQFRERETYPIAVIWLSVSHPSDDPLAVVSQQLETRALVDRLTEQRNQFSTMLPTPLVFQVQTTEQGPQFAMLAPEHVNSHIQKLVGKDVPTFEVRGTFPFHYQGDHPLQLDFSHDVILPITLRLQAQPDAFPEDCIEDFSEIQPLAVPPHADFVAFLQSYLVSVSPDDLVVYGTHLRMVLVTAYYYGYGKTAWAQEYIQEWCSLREEYQFKLGENEIRAAIERIYNGPWVLPKELDTDPIDEDTLQEYIHTQLERDPVLERYSIGAVWEENSEPAGLTVKITWLGRLVGVIDVSRGASLSPDEKKENQRLLHTFDLLFNKTPTTSVVDQFSRALQTFHKFVKTLRQEVLAAQPSRDSLPADLSTLLTESKKYQSNSERAGTFLAMARAYGMHGNETLLRYAMAEYCFWRGRQLVSEARRSRSYLQVFFFLLGQVSHDPPPAFIGEFYRSSALYFGSYLFQVDVKDGTTTDIASKFYASLLQTLANVNQKQYEPLGRCLVGLAAVNPWLIFDLINRVKYRKDATKQLQKITCALQEEQIFKTETTACLHLLGRIDPGTVASTLAEKTFASADERRRIVHALLSVASATNAPSAEVLLHDFAAQATSEKRFRLAFSLLVEPFVLRVPDKEGALKASLIAETIGLNSDMVGTEYFLGKAAEISQLFDRFYGSQDPNAKGQFAITILETINSTRRQLLNDLPRNMANRAQRELVQHFFNGTQTYVTTEQSKLIYDTTLEIVLVNNRTLYSPQHTRITIEIRRVDEGIAEHLHLEVLPVEGQYKVEERHPIERIDVLGNKTPMQRELFIQPLVNINESIELNLILRYDTLKTKAKEARLAANNQTVWFYPENQFLRVPQNYNTSAPAINWFYGRKEQLEGMADNLRTGIEHDSSLIVYGLKRAGKTSVVQRFITHTLRERGLHKTHIPIYIDLLKHPHARMLRTDGSFLYFLIEILYQELANKQQLRLPFTLQQVQEKFRQDAFMAFLAYLEIMLQALHDKRVLLVLDEFSKLYELVAHPTAEKGLTSDLFSFLSNTIQNTHQLTFIFTGTYMLFDMMRNYMDDLAKICRSRMISFLDDTSARKLITEPVQRNPNEPTTGWLDYDPRVIDFIVTDTHCHPYLIQCLCGLLVDRMNDLKYHRVNLNDLEAILSDIITKPAHEGMMLNMWNDFDANQQKVLSVIAALTDTAQSWVEINDIEATFKELKETILTDEIDTIFASLTDAELLEKNIPTSDQSEAYRITIPLYQMWLKHNKSLRTVFGNRSLTTPS